MVKIQRGQGGATRAIQSSPIYMEWQGFRSQFGLGQSRSFQLKRHIGVVKQSVIIGAYAISRGTFLGQLIYSEALFLTLQKKQKKWGRGSGIGRNPFTAGPAKI